jgi:ABC-type uncharacterized transport system involved in gliding motility auxiliary subunit
MSEEELQGDRPTQMNEGTDHRGPVTLGAAIVVGRVQEDPAEQESVEGGEGAATDGESDEAADEAPSPETRLLLFGDSDFPSNTYFQLAGNGDLILSGIAWLAEQGELVSIRPKSATPRIVVLTSQQAFFYFWTIVAFAPLAITVAGVGIWMRRKKL